MLEHSEIPEAICNRLAVQPQAISQLEPITGLFDHQCSPSLPYVWWPRALIALGNSHACVSVCVCTCNCAQVAAVQPACLPDASLCIKVCKCSDVPLTRHPQKCAHPSIHEDDKEDSEPYKQPKGD